LLEKDEILLPTASIMHMDHGLMKILARFVKKIAKKSERRS